MLELVAWVLFGAFIGGSLVYAFMQEAGEPRVAEEQSEHGKVPL